MNKLIPDFTVSEFRCKRFCNAFLSTASIFTMTLSLFFYFGANSAHGGNQSTLTPEIETLLKPNSFHGMGVRKKKFEKIYDETMLKPEELGQCIQWEEAITDSERSLENIRTELSSNLLALNELEKKTMQKEIFLDHQAKTTFNKQSEVDNFNAEVIIYNDLIKTYNLSLEVYKNQENTYNQRVMNHNRQIHTLSAKCSGRNYYVEDRFMTSK